MEGDRKELSRERRRRRRGDWDNVNRKEMVNRKKGGKNGKYNTKIGEKGEENMTLDRGSRRENEENEVEWGRKRDMERKTKKKTIKAGR